jgi:uncharacterized protein (DUF58 family)
LPLRPSPSPAPAAAPGHLVSTARRPRAATDEIRITTVGLWFVLLCVLVAVAATNTGNNALYTVLAVMFALLVLSGLLSRQNVRGLTVELEPPSEVFANRPFTMDFTVRSRARLLPRWFLLLRLSRDGQPRLIPYLPRRGRSAGRLDAIVAARGPYRFAFARVSSLFPFGFFRKGVRYRTDLDVLVFPEVFAAGSERPEELEHLGERPSRRAGWGHGLFALRGFRQGDDPRSIHWKQTARTGGIVYMEREAEQSRRLSIIFDNAVGELPDDTLRGRFERLVSEAATAALHHLARGFEVELVTRDRVVGFGGGPRQRVAILEALALIGSLPLRNDPLLSTDARAAQLRIRMDSADGAPARQQVEVIAL